MIINGKTNLFYVSHNGIRQTRVCGKLFNQVLKTKENPTFLDVNGRKMTPSKGLSWEQVSDLVRSGKSAQAKAE